MLPQHANRNRSPFPAEPRQVSDREDIAYRRETGHPPAANIQAPSDAELIDILQRALRGDPYPVSGRTVAPESPQPEPALADRIRDILGSNGQQWPDVHPSAPARELAYAPAYAPTPTYQSAPTPVPAYRPELARSAEMRPAAMLQHEVPGRDLPETKFEEPAPARTVQQAFTPEFLAEPVVPLRQHLQEHDESALPARQSRRGRSFGLVSIAFVASVALAGALIPALMAGPAQYVAAARLQLQTAAVSQPGYLDVVAQRIASSHLLSQVVAKLKLDRDPEFTGGADGPLGIAVDLVSGNGAASDSLSRAQLTLRNAINVSENRPSGLLMLSVTTENPAKSARIANMLADATVYDAVVSQGADLPGQASAVDESRKAYDQAAAALTSFTKSAGEDKIKAAIDLQQQRDQLGKQAVDAEKAVVDARIRLTAAKTAKLQDVLDGSLSPDLRSSPALEALRDRYAAAKTTLSQLSADLGPRHPRLLAQQATVDDLRNNIQTELQRLVAACDADVKTALTDQKTVADRLTALGNRNVGVDMSRLGQLQDGVESARGHYENAVQGGGAAKPSAAPMPLSVIAPAVAPVAPIDDNLTATQTAGFLMGLGIALCLVFLRAWLFDMLRDAEESDPSAIAQNELHAEPILEAHRHPIAVPEPKFDPAVSVANDRPVPARVQQQDAGEDLAALQERMAMLRAKVEDYAMRRRGSLS